MWIGLYYGRFFAQNHLVTRNRKKFRWVQKVFALDRNINRLIVQLQDPNFKLVAQIIDTLILLFNSRFDQNINRLIAQLQDPNFKLATK
jgi:hypothetical protein